VFTLPDELTNAVFRLLETLTKLALIVPEVAVMLALRWLDTLIKAVFKFADELTKLLFTALICAFSVLETLTKLLLIVPEVAVTVAFR